jgi:prepilin-type N-terminal cleavage/methylation domain-containing protein
MFRARVSKQAKGKSAGFSLIELVVVLALMAMMALIATPWFVRMGQRNQIRSAAHELQTTLLAARMKAVNLNQPVSVVVAAITPPLRFDTMTSVAALTPTPTPLARLILPERAAELIETPSVAGGTITFGGDGRVINIDSRTPAVFRIQGPVGMRTPNQYEIRTTSGGRVEVTPRFIQ